MDVDLLRPGTVPISKDTIMWFEFLLDPTILESHLSKPKPDPAPAELISKFLSISADITGGRDVVMVDPEAEAEDKPIPNRRSLGLKILALKTASIINWDLDTLESKLPFCVQWALLQDLLSLVHGEMMSGDISKEPDHVLFAVSLYHRWALRALFNNALQNKLRNGSTMEMLDDRLIRLQRESEHSVQVLSDISKLVLDSHVLIPSSATFVPLKEDNCDINTPDWSLGVYISSSQFLTMVIMDLAAYLFFQEDYTLALGYFEKCKMEFDKWNRQMEFGNAEPVYCKVERETLNGYIMASKPPVMSTGLSLTDRFMVSVNHHYEGILTILMEDNMKRELPFSLRERLELDIAAAISSGGFTTTRDLIFQIQSLNTVYRRAQDLPCHGLYDYGEKLTAARRGCDIFLWALRGTLQSATKDEQDRLSLFVVELLESLEPAVRHELLNYDLVREQVRDIQLEVQDAPVTQPQTRPFTPPDFNNMELKKNEWEQQLRLSYDPMVIRELVNHLADANVIRPACQIESKWELGIPLHGIVLSLPSLTGILPLQHYVYILLGKAKYLDSLGRYDTARRLLLAAEAEVAHNEGYHPSLIKLAQLIAWEILLVESHHLHANWPNKTTGWETMAGRCTDVLRMTAGEAGVLPRVEVVEQAAVTLLNLGEWEAVAAAVPDRRIALCDLAAALALACQDIVRFKGAKKISRGAWDLVVPVFGPSGVLGKRGQAYDAALVQPVARFFAALRDSTAISAAVSLLARLHNVLRDEATLELGCEHAALWPSVVSNASSYNIQLVSEQLVQLVNSALEYYPKNPNLHKLLGDYYFVGSQHGAAIKNYLLSIILATDSLSRPLSKGTVEDGVIKRMIKSLGQLNNHTQAGVLCQFLEEVDYNTAFKSFSETISNDCMDTYYDCVWDVNILEYLIYLQNKRGNKDRAKKAIDMIGLLELNANNNEEIKREAANKRKVKFMQALIRQYVM